MKPIRGKAGFLLVFELTTAVARGTEACTQLQTPTERKRILHTHKKERRSEQVIPTPSSNHSLHTYKRREDERRDALKKIETKIGGTQVSSSLFGGLVTPRST
jgi:hypothetical protein